MAIYGIGIDIIEIYRIESVISRKGNKLAKRILSNNEWNRYQQHNRPTRFLAKHFAVKEAASKAFGIGISNGLSFSQFEVFNDQLGKPSLRLLFQAEDLAKKLSIAFIHVTLSDERYYACATVILEC